ncbi:MAG TPA: hypothetical protein VHF65_00135 [Nitrososphaera sp.]|nr:hypothetical protein [Nitrososphaera sp.]
MPIAKMLVKVDNIMGDSVKVMKLDIDEFGSVIPLTELELRLPQDDYSISQTLRHSVYAILFTADDSEYGSSAAILTRRMTTEELNQERKRTI